MLSLRCAARAPPGAAPVSTGQHMTSAHRASRRAHAWRIIRGTLSCALAFVLTVHASGITCAQEITLATTRALQESSQPPVNEETISLAGEMDLRRLVDLAATRLQVRIDYDPKLLAGSITIRAPRPVTDQELWDLTNQSLISRGLATIRPSGSSGLSVVRLQDAAETARLETDNESIEAVVWDPAAPPASFISVMISVQHADRTAVAKSIQPLLSKPGGSTAQLGDSALRISDLRSRVSHALTLVRSVDKPLGEAGIERFRVTNQPAAEMVALATDVAAKLAQSTGQVISGSLVPSPDGTHVLIIAPQGAAAQWVALLTELDTREPVVTKSYSVKWHALSDVQKLIEDSILAPAPGLAADTRFRVSADPLSGSLVVSASDRVHAEVDALMQRLDQAPMQTRRPMRTFEIRNRSADEVLTLLQQLIDAGDADSASPEPIADTDSLPTLASRSARSPSDSLRRDTPAIPDTTGSESAGLVMTADASTNTIIAIGEPRQLEHIESLLPSLDRRQAQVEFEVLILSLTEGDTLDLGAELEYITKQQSTTIALASLFGLSSGANAARTAAGIGGTALILDPGDFAVVIRALETISKGRSLSMPRLLAGNNKPATINSVLQQPFTSTNASDTVATTSFGGTQDAGTNVTITPTIAAGDHLVLEYQISISAFVGESSSPGVPPPRQQNSVSGSVTIPDGHTVAIGGLKLATDAKATSQIPLLGDLPLLGEAFKNRSNSGSESRFYVFIRANVLRHSTFEDLKRYSADRMRDADLSDGMPVVTPRIIR